MHFRNLSPPASPQSLFWVAPPWSVSESSRQKGREAGRQFLVLITGHLRSTLSKEKRDGQGTAAANICGVVVMWGLNKWDGSLSLRRTKTIAQTGRFPFRQPKNARNRRSHFHDLMSQLGVQIS